MFGDLVCVPAGSVLGGQHIVTPDTGHTDVSNGSVGSGGAPSKPGNTMNTVFVCYWYTHFIIHTIKPTLFFVYRKGFESHWNSSAR